MPSKSNKISKRWIRRIRKACFVTPQAFGWPALTRRFEVPVLSAGPQLRSADRGDPGHMCPLRGGGSRLSICSAFRRRATKVLSKVAWSIREILGSLKVFVIY